MVDYSEIFEKQTLAEFQSASEKVFIEQRLKTFNGNVAKTARSLDIQRCHVYTKIERYDIEYKSFVEYARKAKRDSDYLCPKCGNLKEKTQALCESCFNPQLTNGEWYKEKRFERIEFPRDYKRIYLNKRD